MCGAVIGMAFHLSIGIFVLNSLDAVDEETNDKTVKNLFLAITIICFIMAFIVLCDTCVNCCLYCMRDRSNYRDNNDDSPQPCNAIRSLASFAQTICFFIITVYFFPGKDCDMGKETCHVGETIAIITIVIWAILLFLIVCCCGCLCVLGCCSLQNPSPIGRHLHEVGNEREREARRREIEIYQARNQNRRAIVDGIAQAPVIGAVIGTVIRPIKHLIIGTEECSICIETGKESEDLNFVELGCKHRFHAACMKTIVNTPTCPNACPLCRKDLTADEIQTLNNPVPTASNLSDVVVIPRTNRPVPTSTAINVRPQQVTDSGAGIGVSTCTAAPAPTPTAPPEPGYVNPALVHNTNRYGATSTTPVRTMCNDKVVNK